MESKWLCNLGLLLLVIICIVNSESIDREKSNQPHSRKKRLVWITDDGRLALPPGTSMTITPTIAMPLVRYPPTGFFSNVSISFPLTIDFDKLGLTDNQNPLGDFPSLFARSMGHQAGDMLASYVARYLHYRRRRDLMDQTEPKTKNFANFRIRRETSVIDDEELKQPELPETHQHAFHGGERVMLYTVVEDFLATFGLNGRACLLRTICEIHSREVNNYGVLGEMAKLFLTANKSPYSSLIPEYVKAQEIGEGKVAPGECFPYYKDCPKSIFRGSQNSKYTDPDHNSEKEDEILDNEIHSM